MLDHNLPVAAALTTPSGRDPFSIDARGQQMRVTLDLRRALSDVIERLSITTSLTNAERLQLIHEATDPAWREDVGLAAQHWRFAFKLSAMHGQSKGFVDALNQIADAFESAERALKGIPS